MARRRHHRGGNAMKRAWALVRSKKISIAQAMKEVHRKGGKRRGGRRRGRARSHRRSRSSSGSGSRGGVLVPSLVGILAAGIAYKAPSKLPAALSSSTVGKIGGALLVSGVVTALGYGAQKLGVRKAGKAAFYGSLAGAIVHVGNALLLKPALSKAAANGSPAAASTMQLLGMGAEFTDITPPGALEGAPNSSVQDFAAHLSEGEVDQGGY